MQLVLDTYGTSLQIENEQFLVKGKSGRQVIPVHSISSIVVNNGVKISTDAIFLAIDKEIDLIFIDKSGKPKGRIWSIQYGSISTIRKAQIEFLYTSMAIQWVKDLIITKLNNQVALLVSLQAAEEVQRRRIQKAIDAIEDHKIKIIKMDGEHLTDMAPAIRGWEGAATRRYFEAVATFMPSGYQFEGRSQHPATNKFNALLNYGYGMLYGKVEGALIKAGLDPYTGVFHRDEYNRPVLVYDVIEKYRVWADHVVIQLCCSDIFIEECFSERNGSVWLEGLGKRILIQSVNDYLDEIIDRNGLQRSRHTHILLEAQELATQFTRAKGIRT
jgi:CRISPR-associated protein Cas1